MALRLDAPAPNTLVGSAGTTIEATLTLGAAAAPAPASIEVSVDSIPLPALAFVSQTGTSTLFRGSYSPPQGLDEAKVLQATMSPAGTAPLTSNALKIVVDTTAPVLSGSLDTCDTSPCQRDGTVVVQTTASDSHLQAVVALLDLDGFSRSVPLATAGGSSFAGTLDLRDWPFPFFAAPVGVRIEARDEAGNVASVQAPSLGTVTRLRWSTSISTSFFNPPVVLPNGTVLSLLGAPLGSNNALAGFTPGGSALTPVPLPFLPGGAPLSEISVSASALWFTSAEGIHEADLGATQILGSCAANAGHSLPVGPPATRSAPFEYAFDVDDGGAILSAQPNGTLTPVCGGGQATDPVDRPPVFSGSTFFVVSRAGTTTRAVQGRDVGGGNLQVAFSPSLTAEGGSEAISAAVEQTGDALVGVGTGRLYRLTKGSAQTDQILSLSGESFTSPLLVDGPTGDIFFAATDLTVRRVSDAGAPRWTIPGLSVIPMLLTSTDSVGVSLVAGTLDSGEIVAIDGSSGKTIWVSPPLAGRLLGLNVGRALAPTSLPTLYFTGMSSNPTSGTLGAVVLDSDLDLSSPWPKAFHDSRNTGNSNSPLP